MKWPAWRERVNGWGSLCRHEGSHAVTAYAHGVPFRYITTRPRIKGHAAHVMGRNGDRPGEWLAQGAVHAAGIIAQEHDGLSYLYDPRELAGLRRHLARDPGRDDLKNLRATARSAWCHARADPEHFTTITSTPVDPTWSPVDIAVLCWRYALITVVSRWEAINEVACALSESTRALTQRDVARIVDGIRPDPDAAMKILEQHAQPWFLDYSRLTWEPSEKWLADVEDYVNLRAAARRGHAG